MTSENELNETPRIANHNLATGEIEIREMNEYELAQWQKDETERLARQKASAEAKIKRKALLDKLEITEEEAKLLLGF